MSIFIWEIALKREESLKTHERKGHHGWIKVIGMASGALWRMYGGEWGFFVVVVGLCFFFFAEFGARRGVGEEKVDDVIHSFLLLNSLKLASDRPTGPPLSILPSDIFSVPILLSLAFWWYLAWLTNLVLLIAFPSVAFMTTEPLDFLDQSSLVSLLAPLWNYYNSLLQWHFSLSPSPIHPFISLIQCRFIEILPWAKHMAIIKL